MYRSSISPTHTKQSQCRGNRARNKFLCDIRPPNNESRLAQSLRKCFRNCKGDRFARSPDGGAPRRRPSPSSAAVSTRRDWIDEPKARLQGVCKRQLQYLSSLARGFVAIGSRSERQFSCTRRLFLGSQPPGLKRSRRAGSSFSVSSAFEVMTGDKSPALRRSNREKNSRSRLQSASLITPCSLSISRRCLGFPKFLTTDGSKRRTAVAGLPL